MSKLKQPVRLALATLVLAASTAVFGAEAKKPALDSALEGASWKPLALQPGEYFKYELVDYTYQNKKGWISLEVKAKGEDQLQVDWKGEREDGQKLSVTTTEQKRDFVARAIPALVRSGVATPFIHTVIALWWDEAGEFKWHMGANRSVVYGEMMPAAFILKIEDYCTVAGYKGFKTRAVVGKVTMSESCVSPKLSLPMQVRANEADNSPRYEAKLVEYRAPAPAKDKQ